MKRLINREGLSPSGKMAWCWVLDQNGVIDGNTVNENGEWTVNGVVQTK
ncbi:MULTISPECIES: hypothetical protein [Hungatella]|nr:MULTISPECIES: hypothetical protein [Hungatella]